MLFAQGMSDLSTKMASAKEAVDKTTAAIEKTQKELKQEIRDMREEAKTVVPEKTGKEVGKAVNEPATAASQTSPTRGPRQGWGHSGWTR